LEGNHLAPSSRSPPDELVSHRGPSGDDYDQAKFYPPIDDLLIERGEMVDDYTVFATAKLD
jgi:hypothetical protein